MPDQPQSQPSDQPEFLPPTEYLCPACGYMLDSPQHELGCAAALTGLGER